MLRRSRGIRWAGLLVGLGVALGGAGLLAQDAAKESGGEIVGNRTTKTFHKPDCAAVKRIAKKSKVEFADAEAATAKGFKPCPLCKPAADAPGDGAEAKEEMPEPKAKGAMKQRPGTKGAMKKGGQPPAKAASADDSPGLKFSRDIAPILVGNCIGCHNPRDKARRKNLDLSTFQGIMAGGADGKVIVPGKPEESMLIHRVSGDETPKMPPGQRNLAAETIAKIGEWIKAGAILDAGIEPTAELAKVAPTPDAMRKAELEKLSPEERDKKAEAIALERWKKASSKTTPEMTADKHLLLFSTMPKERAKNILKALEVQAGNLSRLLGPAGANAAINGPEKVSIYVFNDANAYAEFVRAVESREVEAGMEAHATLGVESPYLAAVDPLAGRDEPAAPKRAPRTKKADADTADGPERSLAGILAEQLASGTAAQCGKPGRWLTAGLGAYFGAQVEPRSPYYKRARSEAYDAFNQGTPKVRDAIGGEAEAARVQGVGLSLIEFLAASSRQAMPAFVRELLPGNEKFDQVVQDGFGMTPEVFMNNWGQFVGSRYGSRGR